MQPAIVISDVHGTTFWKDMVDKREPEDLVIFLGDYFDRRGSGPFADSDLQNFLDICAYAVKTPKTILLVGNHDYQYLPFATWHVEPWGVYEQQTRDALMANLEKLNMIFVDRSGIKPIIFSHGGLTQEFMDLHDLEMPEQINSLWLENPEAFDWRERDPVTGRYSRLDGDDKWQSPIWARDAAIEEDGVAGYNQIVGHTPTRYPKWLSTIHGDLFLLTCTLDNTFIKLP